jgi:hypothetical protein
MAGLFVHPCTRPATASQAREPDSPLGPRPLPHPWGNWRSIIASLLTPTLAPKSWCDRAAYRIAASSKGGLTAHQSRPWPLEGVSTWLLASPCRCGMRRVKGVRARPLRFGSCLAAALPDHPWSSVRSVRRDIVSRRKYIRSHPPDSKNNRADCSLSIDVENSQAH